MVVKPRAEETVSLTILNQINGLNEQSRLLTFALKRAVTDVVKHDTAAARATRSRTRLLVRSSSIAM